MAEKKSEETATEQNHENIESKMQIKTETENSKMQSEKENNMSEKASEKMTASQKPSEKSSVTSDAVGKGSGLPEKSTIVPINPPCTMSPSSRFSIPSFTKAPPNDLYRKLLPAVLFLLTFVTVMTMLLVYMDTVALGAQQFRANMSRDYELGRIPQDSPALIAFVRQLHLRPRAPHKAPPVPEPTDRLKVVDSLLGDEYNGTFIDFLPSGPRDPTTLYLENARGWSGIAVRAAPRDYLSLRGAAPALHACLSPSRHPREITYHDSEYRSSLFSSRVLCLPLYTVAAAGGVTRAQYAALGGTELLPHLPHVPFDKLHLQILDIRSPAGPLRDNVTEFLLNKNYTIAATMDDGVMYYLKEEL